MATPIGTGLNGKIDFRSNIYDIPCNGKTGCTVANVTIKPNPTNTGGLYWDSTDGLGVRGGENDEINYPETLTVTFASSVNLAGIWFTDLSWLPTGVVMAKPRRSRCISGPAIWDLSLSTPMNRLPT